VRPSLALFALALLLAGGAFLFAESYAPLPQTLGQNGWRVARELVAVLARTGRLRAALPQLEHDIARLSASVDDLGRRLAAAVRDELYVVVNPGTNRLLLRRGERVLLEAKISTGRNDTLWSGRRSWIFETPRGELSVIRKKKDPVWLKPDWAFIEKGESIPAWDSPLRREKGVLGNFMLDLGGGVMIHGTPQEHLLGRSVTHGCVRVGSEDLRVLFDSVPVGTRVFIY
jgi:L,D-transpeptidase YbiS